MSNIVSPLKIQGKKTKIVPLIVEKAESIDFDNYCEPFLGSGEVLFNISPNHAIVSDNNQLIINFFNDIKNKKFNHKDVRSFLEIHGKKLSEEGQDYFYKMRKEFNANRDSLYFLFINRSCFNGMIRFNSKGEFNVPFCRKPDRFSKAYITKIVNQVARIEELILEHGDNWVFICQDWSKTLKMIDPANTLVYLDPPYVNRNATYFDDWTDEKNEMLFKYLTKTDAKFILSNWKQNQWRKNDALSTFEADPKFKFTIKDHFYFVGAKIENRNPIEECLVTNF